MKKTLLLLLVSIFTFSVYAQDSNESLYYQNIESSKDLGLTADQVARIKKLKKEVGPKFAAIGKDRTLSGYEKGQKKRALAEKHRAEIRAILTENQAQTWEQKYGTSSVKDIISDSYDAKLDRLEDRYDAEKKAIERNDALSKDERKARIKVLKETYKAEKKALKSQKQAAKTGIFN